MKRATFLLVLLAASVGTTVAQTSIELVMLPKDTPIKLKMAQTLTSKHAYVGERVELVVADDIVMEDLLLVPRGTRVLGTVNFGKQKEGAKNNPHRVVIQIDYIRHGERRILLSGMHSEKGKVDKGNVAAGAVLLGLSGVFLAMDSVTAEIKEGTEVNALVAEDVELPSLGPAPKKPDQVEPVPNSAPKPDGSLR